MTKKVAIIDYGLGNLFSINQALKHVGLQPVITKDPQAIATADALILPGVGAFGNAMDCLIQTELIAPIMDFAKTGKPFLGICLGMQLLFTESEEFGHHNGLNLIQGKILRFPKVNLSQELNRVPQIQWNQIYKNTDDIWNSSLLKNTCEGAYMYFVHSYFAKPENEKEVLSYTEYGGLKYASSVIKDNIIGIQFHPEKSAVQGIQIYQTWANLI